MGLATSMPSVEVSVLMPAYRSTATIQGAIESALELPSAEVIVAPDDGSKAYQRLEQLYPRRVSGKGKAFSLR
jgi:glycosyltransferase involved in cell wall biosynthesis